MTVPLVKELVLVRCATTTPFSRHVITPSIWLTSHWSRMVRAVNDGVLSLKDRDFSMSVTCTSRDEVGELATSFNGLGDRLRVERQSLYQRELMLDTVIQATPLALVLTNDADAVRTA